MALEKNNTVTPLYLGDISLRNQGAERIAAAFEKNSTVTAIYLFCHDIGNQGGERIAVALEKNSTVQRHQFPGHRADRGGIGEEQHRDTPLP